MYRQRIRDVYDHLSPGYRRVADFLLNRYREAAFMTAAQIGKAADVDTTLVVRFAQRLDYPGFPELIADVREDVKRDLREVYEPAPEENTPAAVFLRSLIEDHNSLEHTILHLQASDVEAIVGILQTAPRIFIAAEGTAVFPAEMFAMRLYVMGLNAFLVPGDLVARTAMLAGLQRDDAFVGLGMVRLTPGVSTALALAQEQGAQTIGIVALPSNPVASAADYVIQAPAWTTGLMPSMTAVTAVLGALVQALSIQMGDRTAEWALRFEQDYSRLALGLKEAMASLPETLTEINPAQERKRTAKTTEEAS